MGVLCTCVKLLTDLQILGCELHKNAFGGRAPPGPAGELYSAPSDPLAVIKGGDGGKGKEMVGIGDREEREGRKRREGVRTDWKRGGG